MLSQKGESLRWNQIFNNKEYFLNKMNNCNEKKAEKPNEILMALSGRVEKEVQCSWEEYFIFLSEGNGKHVSWEIKRLWLL